MPSIIFKMPARYAKRRGPRCAEHNAYKQRDEVLFRLGFASYRDYLKSELWKLIREAKLAVDPKCEICNSVAGQVHHIAYNRQVLQGKNRRKLVSVCEECHCKIEFHPPDGRKRSFESAYKKTKQLLRRVGKWDDHTRHGDKQK